MERTITLDFNLGFENPNIRPAGTFTLSISSGRSTKDRIFKFSTDRIADQLGASYSLFKRKEPFFELVSEGMSGYIEPAFVEILKSESGSKRLDEMAKLPDLAREKQILLRIFLRSILDFFHVWNTGRHSPCDIFRYLKVENIQENFYFKREFVVDLTDDEVSSLME